MDGALHRGRARPLRGGPGLKGYNAICYGIFLPGIDEPMLIAIHRDGRVDTGSVKNVIMCLDR